MSIQNWDLKTALEAAIDKAGGIRALARELDWHHPNISAIRDGDRISPFRAAQLAGYMDLGRAAEDEAMYSALSDLAKADAERDFWLQRKLEAQLRHTARQLAIDSWIASGSKSPELLAQLEDSVLQQLIEDGASRASAKRAKTA